MLKMVYYAQNDGQFGPDVTLVGDPGVDNTTLLNAGYLGGVIVAIKLSATAGRGNVVVPCDGATLVPYGNLINGPGEFAGAIGPSGSGKISVVRAWPEFLVDTQAYDTTATFTVGTPVYCGQGAKAGLFVATQPGSGYTEAVGLCTLVPTASYPWLGVASHL
jgi:hypothetical protein